MQPVSQIPAPLNPPPSDPTAERSTTPGFAATASSGSHSAAAKPLSTHRPLPNTTAINSWRSLSTRLLCLTAGVVLFAEIVTFVPSLAQERRIWLDRRGWEE